MEPLTPHLRRATIDDAALLSELGARTFSDTFAADNTAEDMAAYLSTSFNPARQTEEITDPHAVVFIAEIEGTAAGYAKLRANDAPECVTGARRIELERLYVATEYLGCGVGAALMARCVEEARAANYETLWLGVWEHNTRARAFYRKWDFLDVGTHIFQVGSDPQNDILMQRAL